PKPGKDKPTVNIPAFSGDSAYQFVQDQVDFGPRVPNTPEHDSCAVYLADKLRSYGADVIVQEAQVTGYKGVKLQMKNIIGQFDPGNKRRIMLYAHWDTRPWADKDPDPDRKREPILGANDGGSGVGVLLEVARQIQQQAPNHGIDIIFFDTEDYGTPAFDPNEGDSRSWCLGSQYWTRNPHKKGYRAKYGILLDMVGGKNASFPKEGTSMHYAYWVVDKIWDSAKRTGNKGFFREDVTSPTTDDHLFVNEEAGIPSACIVEYHSDVLAMGLVGYGSFHHTHLDNMNVISAETLEAVGETVMHVIYTE
ncbi:MAG: M28 family peptidase, partial [Flavobacteriales bacterium]|nr:M28 family peptidase [Flavobacteriales bacterium]